MQTEADRGESSMSGWIARASSDVTRLLAAPGMWRLSDCEVRVGVEAAYRLATQAQAAALTMLGELDARGLAVEAGAPSTAAWWTATRRMRPQDAKRDVALARLLQGATSDVTSGSAGPDPAGGGAGVGVEGRAVRDRLAVGEVNIEQAAVIATALGELPDDAAVSTRVMAERLLVDEAALHGPAALCRLGHRIVERVDPVAADRRLAEQLAREEAEARRLRSGSRYADGHGSVCYRFRLPVGDDALVLPILDTLAAPEPAGDGADGTDPRSPQQRLADAFVETFRRAGLHADLPTKGGDRPRVLVSIDLDKLQTGLGCGAMVDTGDQLGAGAIRRLCCDAQIIPIVLGGASQILDLGRARRTFDGPIRLAVIARDQGCVVVSRRRDISSAPVHRPVTP